MEIWQIALILLGLAWAVQAAGTFYQMRHFRSIMGAVSEKWDDGRVGAGNARGRLAKGVIAVIVVDPGNVLRRVLVMEGRSVFAKFVPRREWEGRPLGALRREIETGTMTPGVAKALAGAIAQFDRVPLAAERDEARLASA